MRPDKPEQQLPHATAATRDLLEAIKKDGIAPAGIVLCIAQQGSPKTLILTALYDNVHATDDATGTPIDPLIGLLESAHAVIRNHMNVKGS